MRTPVRGNGTSDIALRLEKWLMNYPFFEGEGCDNGDPIHR
jgi:hypothetical protein